jgi:microcystin-dependent protein
MGLETGTYIDSLVVANPAATDALSQADEHLRLIKATVKATFPSVTGAVTATHTAINTKVAEPVSAITSDGSAPSLASGITGAEVKTLIGVVEPAISTDGSTPSLSSGITAEEVRALIGAAEAATTATLLAVYPVGSIYTSVAGTNPGTFFGGQWNPFGQGKVMIGVDSTDTDFDTVENTGGAKTHTLITDEIPSHTHSMSIENASGTGSTGSSNGASSFSTVNTSATGGDQAHNNLQPYVVVYMWKRTA